MVHDPHGVPTKSTTTRGRPPLAPARPRATYTSGMPTRPTDLPAESALISRRAALARTAALLGSALAAPTIAGVLAGCGDQKTSGTAAAQALRALTPEQEQLVAAVAEVILPATDTPGARDVGVSLFVDRMLADYHTAEAREKFAAGLARLDASAQAQHGKAFVSCTAAQQFALVDALDAQLFDPKAEHTGADPRAFYGVLKELTLAGYYTSEAGATRELRVNPMGRWRADVPYTQLGAGWA